LPVPNASVTVPSFESVNDLNQVSCAEAAVVATMSAAGKTSLNPMARHIAAA